MVAKGAIMANPTTPFGLIPRKKVGSGVYNAGIMQFSVPATDTTSIFVGDLVTQVGTSQIINGVVYPDVKQGATGDIFCGVVIGVLPVTANSFPYRNASTQRILLVNVDPDAEFEIRQNAGAPILTANDIGLNANVLVAAGNTSYGWSGMSLNGTGAATTNTLDLKIIGMSSRPDNEVGTAPGTGSDSSTFFVRINRHRYSNQVTGV